MTEKKNLLPKLRFPEFRGDWESKNLGSVARLRNGYAFKSAEYVDDGPYQIITIANVQQGNLLIESTKRMAALPPDIQQHQVLSLEDILISMTGNVGRVCHVTDEGLLLNQRVGKLVPIEIDAAFFYQLLQRDEFRNSMQLKAAGGAQGNLSAGDITEYAFSVPVEPSEQQKIADCLSSLDELIAAQARKVDALKTHKKGLMQQLFPREGETQPRLRFPEFRDAEAWRKCSLKDVFSIFQGFAFSSNDSVDNGVRWLKIADVGIQHMSHSTPSHLPFQFKRKFEKFSVAEGDYVVALTRPILSGQLKMAQVDQIFAGALLNQRVGKLMTTHHLPFVYFLLQCQQTIGDIEKSISGSEPPNLSAQQIESIKTFIPSELEQIRIANCLTSLDDLITATTQQLATLKTHKKGLMQQLFPSAAELAA